MRNNVGLTFNVDDTVPQSTISIELDKLQLVILNIIFSVATPIFSNSGSPTNLFLHV